MKLLTAAERQVEQRGVSLLLVGPTGVGKTSQVKTLESRFASTLLVDIEAGILPVRHLPIGSVPVKTMREFMDLACARGGANPALSSSSAFSQAHYEKVTADPELMRFAEFDTLVVDSLTALSRLCLTHCEQLPEGLTDRGRKDTRAIYGLHARTMLGTLNHLQHAPGLTVVLVAILERVTEAFNVATWQPQLEGAKTGRELPGIVDEVVTMTWVDFGDGKPPARAFVCTSPNPWGYPGKDRSGRLDQLEPPNLGELLKKIAPSATGE
jgi:AAA domain